jgi:hypothetical protein
MVAMMFVIIVTLVVVPMATTTATAMCALVVFHLGCGISFFDRHFRHLKTTLAGS